jgi:hypothetical protein
MLPDGLKQAFGGKVSSRKKFAAHGLRAPDGVKIFSERGHLKLLLRGGIKVKFDTRKI